MRVVLCVAAVVCMFDVAPSIAAERGDPQIAKRVLRAEQSGENLLKPDAWRPWQKGFDRDGQTFVCDNGDDAKVQRGASQTVVLNQTTARADRGRGLEQGRGRRRLGRQRLLALSRPDLRRRHARSGARRRRSPPARTTGSAARSCVLPEKPVKSVSCLPAAARPRRQGLVPRRRSCAWCKTPAGACLFDGVPVVPVGAARQGFQVRDVAAGSDFVRIETEGRSG